VTLTAHYDAREQDTNIMLSIETQTLCPKYHSNSVLLQGKKVSLDIMQYLNNSTKNVYVYIRYSIKVLLVSLYTYDVQLVEALCYKPEGCGFDSRGCHWNFSMT
jgi:hypothetical protein